MRGSFCLLPSVPYCQIGSIEDLPSLNEQESRQARRELLAIRINRWKNFSGKESRWGIAPCVEEYSSILFDERVTICLDDEFLKSKNEKIRMKIIKQ